MEKSKAILVTGHGGARGCETARLSHFFRQSAHIYFYFFIYNLNQQSEFTLYKLIL
jgi:hypothetical protein